MTSPAINAAGRSRVGRRALLALLSLSVFVAAIALPTGLHGQPQGKEKKQKAKQTQVRTVTIVTGLWHPWSLAWLPNGDMLVTERNGKLRTVRDNRLDPDPVAGIPAVMQCDCPDHRCIQRQRRAGAREPPRQDLALARRRNPRPGQSVPGQARLSA
jgi:glucose/arabinose dehydrogenase